MSALTVFSAIGAVGYGIPESSVRTARENFDIDAITADGGSIDGGPNYLAENKPVSSWDNVKKDLRLLLTTRDQEDVPLLIGSCITSGSGPVLDKTVELAKEIAAEEDLSFTLAKLYADVDKDYLTEKIESSEVKQLDFEKELTSADANRAENIVGQLGVEPFVDALDAGADVVLGGRSVDIAPMSAVPIRRGYPKGLALHMGKLLECGALAANPPSGSDGMVGIITEDYFDVVPPNENRKCTVDSVAAHTLYEKVDPYTIKLPGGRVDLSDSEYEQLGGGQVRVSGSRFTPEEYTILLEGVERAGHRAIVPGGVKGPAISDSLEDIFEDIKQDIPSLVDVPEETYSLRLRTYGNNQGVPLNTSEPAVDTPNELGLIIDVVGDTKEIANNVCTMAKSELLHKDFEGRYAISGNVAFPYSPAEIDAGQTYRFSIHHLLTDVAPGDVAQLKTEVI